MKKQTRERWSSWLRGELDLTNTLPEAPMPEQTGEPEQPHPLVDWQPKPIKPLEQRELRERQVDQEQRERQGRQRHQRAELRRTRCTRCQSSRFPHRTWGRSWLRIEHQQV